MTTKKIAWLEVFVNELDWLIISPYSWVGLDWGFTVQRSQSSYAHLGCVHGSYSLFTTKKLIISDGQMPLLIIDKPLLKIHRKKTRR